MKRNDIIKAILTALATTGAIAIAITVPNLFQIFSSYGKFSKNHNWNIKRSLESSYRKGYIKKTRKGLVITKIGRMKLARISLNEMTLSSPEDGLIRLVIFDIPISKNKVRNIFTVKLKSLGFNYLQRSIWMINKPCENEIIELSRILGIDNFVKIIVTNEVIDFR